RRTFRTMKRSQLMGTLCLVAAGTWQAGGEAAAQEIGASGASSPEGGAVCTVAGAATALPDEVRETSGLAGSARSADLFWTHNDAGNAAELFAVNAAGQLVQRVVVEGADSVDWEDI